MQYQRERLMSNIYIAGNIYTLYILFAYKKVCHPEFPERDKRHKVIHYQLMLENQPARNYMFFILGLKTVIEYRVKTVTLLIIKSFAKLIL